MRKVVQNRECYLELRQDSGTLWLVGHRRMRVWRGVSIALAAACVCGGLSALEPSAYQYYRERFSPEQSQEKAEFSWSRLRYTSPRYGSARYGGYGGAWSTDYPKADRQFLIALKRLTRIDGRSTEQVVDLDHDDIDNYPWIYAVQVQNWTFTEPEAKHLREFLLKGGFLMVDDFHGTVDWENFMRGMRLVFLDRPIEDLENKDEIFHVLYDLDERFQVPGEQYVNTGRTYEKGRLRSEVARNSRRQRAYHRCNLPQHASGRRLGMGGQPRIS